MFSHTNFHKNWIKMNTKIQINTNKFSELMEIISESKTFLFWDNLIKPPSFIKFKTLFFISLFSVKIEYMKNISEKIYPGILIESI